MEVKKKFDFVEFAGNALSYAQHGRLMTIMVCLGGLAGMCYFVYATPLYSAKSAVYFRVFGSPVSDRGVAETTTSHSSALRNLPKQLTSQKNVLATAKRMGLVGADASFEDVSTIGLSVKAGLVDHTHMEVSVLNRDPDVVKNFCEALVAEFRIQQEEAWEEYRNQALVRYAKDVEALEDQAVSSFRSLSKFERDGKMTEAAIEQSRLNMIPVDLVTTKELMGRMTEVQSKLTELQGHSGSSVEQSVDDMFMELSLLTAFEKEREIRVGDLVRRATTGPLVAPKDKGKTEVVVQPSMVETLQPWQLLEKDRRVIEDKLQQSSKIYLPDHAIVRELKTKLLDNERALRAELVVLRQSFELEFVQIKEKHADLEQRLPEYYKINEEIGLASQAYMNMEKGKALWDKARDSLADKLAVISFSQDQEWTELRFKEHISLRDEVPISPNKMRLLMITAMVSIGGALGASTLVNLMSSGVSTLHQIESVTGLMAMGVIPHTSKEMLENIARSPALGAKVPNHLLECFRLIRGHILLHPNAKGMSQVIMVTSARPSEGKTSQAANLAWAFQSVGSRTLLIDCDLRRGRAHQIADVANEPGMTRLLMGACSVEEAILKTANPLMDVIPRGPVVVGTTELLCQRVFHDLIERFRGEYDQIILDTPPLLGLSETVTIQKVADGVVIVVRAEQTSRKDVADAVTMLRKTGANIIGMVLNGLDLSKARNYYNYYYYSSAYYDRDFPLDDNEGKRARA